MLDFFGSVFVASGPALGLTVLVCAYFIGNISPATLIAKAAGVDIRREGSGNPGTTNVLRVLGKKAAVGTLVIDVLKGAAAVLLGKFIGGEALAVLCGLFVFIGHVWPAVFHFKGGKGVATAFGVLLAINWIVALLCLASAGLGALVSRRMSIGSIVGAAALVVLGGFYETEYIAVFVVMALIVIFKHRGNIKRIINGDEPKLNFNK